MVAPPSVDLLRELPISGCRIKVFYSGFEEKTSKSPLPAPFTGMEPAGQWLFLLHLFFYFFFPCPKRNAVHKCESRSLTEATFQQIGRHFLPVPAPCDGWTHSNLRFPSLTLYSASTGIIFFLSFFNFFFPFLLFAFCNAAWEHRLTLYPWPDSLTKNSSHSATRVQSHRRHAAAGKQGGHISPCSQNQTHERRTEDFVCLPPF